MLIESGRAVITRQFGNPVYVGDPINAIKIFNDKEVDEMVILDITSASKRSEPDYDMISNLASESFMPVTYGGHIRNMDQAERIVNCGVEKLSFNSGLFSDPKIVSDFSSRYGRQSVVASIDIKTDLFGRQKIKTENGRKTIDLSIEQCAKHVISIGVGEVFLTSVNRDGMLNGYDYSLISAFKELLNVPIVASGGAASVDDFKKAVQAGASAVAAGAIFYFKGSFNSVLINYPDQKILKEKLYELI